MKKSLFFLAALLFMTPIYADIYKWKDANGRTHYGDTLSVTETIKARTGNQAEDRITKGEKMVAQTENLTRRSALNESKEPVTSSVYKVYNVQ